MLSILVLASGLIVQERPQEPGRGSVDGFADIVACRTIADPALRLACYDQAVPALQEARTRGDVVVIDRNGVAETRRQLFGFEAPDLGRLFGAQALPDIDAVETTLTSASEVSDDRWIFRLADGGVWRQIDSGAVRFRNRANEPVRVRRAALGSYLLTVGNSRAVRVRRQ